VNSDFVKAYFKDAVVKSLKTGAGTMLEEMADTLTEEQLTDLIKIISKVRDKKKNTRNTVESA
jgi:hypothetical protein